ncbi:hemolysin family protein [Sphingomonas sp. R647]|uniref:hemolysin family protein n=1 Tax=Sphingomonas sp. R647 TaxID=2875233 RepID=UPI001CD55282|nr:hemolysin family protein [Sphingomonas sp. R647]MCA1197149.1 hemolysin family protein [Sphingomonas sp. R647]
MTDVLLPILIIVILIVINGVFVAAEFALVGARRSRLQTLANGGSAAARWLVRIFDREGGKDSYIAIAQLGITLASIGLGMYGEPAVAAWLYPGLERAGLTYDQAHIVGFIIALGAITYLHVVFGEMIPKAMALQVPEQVSLSVNPVMRMFGFLFKPMVYLLNQTAFGLMRILGIPDPGKSSLLYSSKELEIATEEVAASGQLDEAQRILIDNIFDMEDRTAEELMTSRSRMRAIALDTPLSDVAALIASSPASRYPIFSHSLDDIGGVLHVKDFIRARIAGRMETLSAVTRPLPRVAATTSATELLALFKKQRTHAALVVDEHGGTLGFVTLDDLVEDLIDEEETPESEWIRKTPEGGLVMDGEVTLAELSEDHGILFDHRDIVTIAGLALSVRGVLPEQGEHIALQGYRLTIEETTGLKITRVRLDPM